MVPKRGSVGGSRLKGSVHRWLLIRPIRRRQLTGGTTSDPSGMEEGEKGEKEWEPGKEVAREEERLCWDGGCRSIQGRSSEPTGCFPPSSIHPSILLQGQGGMDEVTASYRSGHSSLHHEDFSKEGIDIHPTIALSPLCFFGLHEMKTSFILHTWKLQRGMW